MSRRRALVLGLAGLVSCSRAPGPHDGPPGRIVTLAPSITEVLYALGAGDRLVGACGECDYPVEAGRLPRVGGYLTPSIEAVIATRPDLVVAVPSPGNREAVRALERDGIRVLVVQDRTLADLWDSIRAVAATLDDAAGGERLVRDVSGRLAAVRARVAGLPARRVLLVVGHSPLIVAGHGTLQDELVELAGGVNVAADVGSAWPQMSLELVVSRAPEVILDAAMGTEAGRRGLYAALTLPASADRRIVSLSADTLFRAGPRVPEAAAALAAAIHPEAFPQASS